MHHKSIFASLALATAMIVPGAAQAQYLPSPRDIANRVRNAVSDAAGQTAAEAGARSVPQPDGSRLHIVTSGSLRPSAQHQMLVRVDAPVTRKGTYRFILRRAGSTGGSGIVYNAFLSDKDLDDTGRYLVRRLETPAIPGDYEMQITREDRGHVLASTPLIVAQHAAPAIDLPATGSAGAQVPVSLSGDRYYFNKLDFVRNGKVVHSHQFDTIITADGEMVTLPGKPGTYDVQVRYGYFESAPRTVSVGRLEVR